MTGDTGQLLGVVSRADLLRLYARPDTAIGQDVTDNVLRRTLWLDTGQVQTCVQAGWSPCRPRSAGAAPPPSPPA